GRARGRGGYRHGGGCLHVERLLELLHEVGELEQSHLLERLEEVVSAHLRHGVYSSFLKFLARGQRVIRVWSGQPSSPGAASAASAASGALASGALASGAPPSAAARLTRSASASWASCTGIALNVAAAPASRAF